MRVLFQRVTRGVAHSVDTEQPLASIARGAVVLAAFEETDTLVLIDQMVQKIRALRVFSDASGKMNLPAAEVGGEWLLVSQFTLFADCRYGNRPSFDKAAPKDKARALYEHFVGACRRQMGEAVTKNTAFGSDLRVEIHNDGPVTLWLDSKELL